jgi:hypothetical protein
MLSDEYKNNSSDRSSFTKSNVIISSHSHLSQRLTSLNVNFINRTCYDFDYYTCTIRVYRIINKNLISNSIMKFKKI